MSTIAAINKPHTYQAASSADQTVAASGKAFPQTLKALQSPATWLTTADTATTHRPNIKAFMDRTGANFTDASELLYGVVGSNTDVRNWAAIMASADPITAARQATGQMYGRTDTSPRSDAAYLSTPDTIARSGNFGLRLLKDDEQKIIDQGVKLVDAQGLILRDAGSSAEQIARNAWLFGFDIQPLGALVEPAKLLSAELSQAVANVVQQPASAKTPLVPTAYALNTTPASDQPIAQADVSDDMNSSPTKTSNNATSPFSADISVTELLNDISEALESTTDSTPIELSNQTATIESANVITPSAPLLPIDTASVVQAAFELSQTTPTSVAAVTPAVDEWLNQVQVPAYIDSAKMISQLFPAIEDAESNTSTN